ncbi:MAG: MFS transporter [Nitrospiria bacterium]
MKQYLELLKNAGFSAFLCTQFLGAFNDNVFKIVISMLAIKNNAETSGVYISLIGAIFMVPFFFFSGYAGYAADRFNKRSILVWTKFVELVAMMLAYFSFLAGRIEWMLAVLFLMALQTTFFSTAKYGILPEMLPDKDLSRANGLVEMSTFFAIILGTAAGGLMFSAWQGHLGTVGWVLVGVALVGYAGSFKISPVTAAKRPVRFQLNPWAEVGRGMKRLSQNRMLWSTVMGISYFAFLGAFLQMDFLLFGSEVMHLDEFSISLLGAFLAVGVGLGSLLAGRLSGDKVELGLVPLGSIGMGLFALKLAFSGDSFAKTAFVLVLLGTAGGLFSVPLYAMLQQRSGKTERGQLIGTSNFLMTVAILSASGFLWLFHDVFSLGPDTIIMILGLFTLAMTPYVMKVIPQYLIRFSLWMLTHTVFKIQMRGQEHVPFRGPALLVCNHVSYIDGLLVGACVQRFIRFVVYREFFEIRGVGRLLKIMRAIPAGGGQKEAVESMKQGRKGLSEGHVVCIFAEGSISETGEMLPFKKGFERMVEDMDVPIIPVHLEGLRGSIYSARKGRFWGWPTNLFLPVSVTFGAPMPATANAREVRKVVMQLGGLAARRQLSLKPEV